MAARRKGNRRQEDPPDVKLSKFLSYICRHGAEKEGLHMSEGGYVAVSAVLGSRGNREGFTEEDVRRVVANCSKQRFALLEEPEMGQLLIRANQGHSLKVAELELTQITSADEAPVVVHGTYRRAWQLIKDQGLSRMKREHIHFAAGLPGESGVISDGIKIFRSANGVILTPGNAEGFLLPRYFEKVVEL